MPEMEERDLLRRGLASLGLKVTPSQENQFFLFQSLLLTASRKFNLTGFKTPEETIVKHFLDTLAPAPLGFFTPGLKVLDLGSGAGFPGLPLKIWMPSLEVTLLEASQKKAAFLKRVAEELGLEVLILTGRAETYGQDLTYREKFSCLVSRAVAPLNVLAEYGLPFLDLGGLFLAYKGPLVEREREEAKHAFEVLGGEETGLYPLAVPLFPAPRFLFVARKVRPTPGRYPRRPGIPSKRPL